MKIIHFTEGATDLIEETASSAASFVRLAEGLGESRVGCLHLNAGASLPRRSIAQACALLTVNGSITVIESNTGLRLDVSGGMGVVLSANEYFALESHNGGVMILVRCQRLRALESGISTPQRIRGQRWPGEESPAGIGKM